MKELRRPRQSSLQTVQLNSLRTPGQSVLTGPQPEESEAVPTDAQLPEALEAPVSEKGAPPSQKQVSERPVYDTLMYDLIVKSTPWTLRDLRPFDYDRGRASAKVYNTLRPQTALDAIACALLTALSNAVHDNLGRAGGNGVREVRDMELRNAFKGALVAEKLIGRIESLRSKHPGTVQVDNVRIEAGGMAILGHVETGARESDSSTDQPVAPEKKQKKKR